jgi:CRP-like cAMP-binding protein
MQRIWHRRQYQANATFVTADQPGEVIYLLREGIVKLSVPGGHGNDLVVALRGVGEVLGEMILFDNPRRSASITTAEESVVLWAARSEFQPYLDHSITLYRNLAQILAQRLRMATGQIQALAGLNVRERLAFQLISLAEEFGQQHADGSVSILLHVKQHDLADMVGTSRASVNTTFSEWKDKGILHLDGKDRITVLNMPLLETQTR